MHVKTEQDLTGRVALITGAGSAAGIGQATSVALAKRGAHLVLADIGAMSEPLREAAKVIGADYGVTAIAVTADVTDDNDLDNLTKVTLEVTGHIDILFNNAGIGAIRDFAECDIADFDRMWAINTRGTVALTARVLPQMRAQGRGVIINNASSAGIYGTRGMTHYCATKHAVVGFTRALAGEVGRDGIRVLAVCPGLIHTEMYTRGLSELGLDPEIEMAKMAQTSALGRFADPSEVAAFVAFAASDAASYLTGSAYHVHGGMPVDALM